MPQLSSREAVNKSCPKYRGNNNKLNVKFISDAVRTAIECGSDEKLISDHILPISIMLSEIYSKNIKYHKELADLCKKYSEMCLITKSEDILLTRKAWLQVCLTTGMVLINMPGTDPLISHLQKCQNNQN